MMTGRRARCAAGCRLWASAVLVYGVGLLDAALPPPLHRADARSVEVVAADGRLLRGFTTADGMWRLPVRAGDVDPLYRQLVLAVEDRRFHWHPGVDPIAVLRAAGQWAWRGRVVSGASTLTMQVARLLEPRLSPDPAAGLPRRLATKAAQAVRAVQLEVRLSKAQILDLYLTLAPFGGNLEGVRAAARAYFGRPPSVLTPAEAALLVALPQAPERLRPDRAAVVSRPGASRPGAPRHGTSVSGVMAVRRARNRVLSQAVSAGLLDPARAAAAMGDPVPTRRLPAPFDAPHLARRLVQAAPARRRHDSWIDIGLQRALQRLAASARPGLEAGSSVALLVVENRRAAPRAVRAYVGAADFFDVRRDGQVDMVPAIRSPGSTLKPVIYAMAFDLGMAHPETVAIDGPTRFGGYRPGNFDRHHRGVISLRAALQLSLNVPAVQLTARLGPARIAGALAAAGTPLRFSRPGIRPSLSVALGGTGVSLEDLVTLYAALADGGRVRPLDYWRGVPRSAAGVRLVGPVAAWQVMEILADAPPPPGWMGGRQDGDGRRIAVKTGTSYGHRDAWAIGSDGVATIGVWVGRPDGRYGQNRSGRNQAAPLLRQAFDRLPLPVDPAARRRVAAGPGGPKPDGVLDAAGPALPPPLRRLTGPWETEPVAPRADAVAIVFPPDGATLPHPAGAQRLVLRAQGGRLPLRWLVDGRPITSLPFRRRVDWRPGGRGRVRITVIDRDGDSDSSSIWLP